MLYNFYKFLDLPQIPDELISGIDAENPGTLMRDYKGWEHLRDGEVIRSSDNPFFVATPELEDWIKQNIISTYKDIGIRFAFGNENVNTAGIHTDATRKFVMQYNIDHADGVLCFWKENNQEILRDGRYQISNYDDVQLLDSVFIPNHTWMILDARVLHSVENLSRTRINIQVSLDENTFL